MTKNALIKLVTIFLGWRLCLVLIGITAALLLPYEPSFPYADVILARSHLPQWFYSWGNFDGVHYLTIVKSGYVGTGLIQAFFPFFPLTIKFLSLLYIPPLVGGLIISNVTALGVVLTLFLLVKEQVSAKVAWISVWVLLLFPSAFFLGALYSESLFLLLVLQAFYAASQKKWSWVGVCVLLATATRLVGVFLIPALLYELWIQSSYTKMKWRTLFTYIKTHYWALLYLGMGSLGLVAYMGYLYITFNDPFYFFHVQSEFGAGRQEQLVLWPQVVWRYIRILLTYRPIHFNYLIFVEELLISLFALGALGLGRRMVKASYLIFALGAYFLPTLTGTFSSMPRYVLVCFPLLIIMAKLISKRTWIGVIWFCLSTMVLIFNTILFIQGYWVS